MGDAGVEEDFLHQLFREPRRAAGTRHESSSERAFRKQVANATMQVSCVGIRAAGRLRGRSPRQAGEDGPSEKYNLWRKPLTITRTGFRSDGCWNELVQFYNEMDS